MEGHHQKAREGPIEPLTNVRPRVWRIAVQSTHPDLPQDTVKKERKKKRKKSINISSNSSASGPDQSLHSHSPTGRDGSFVSTPQVEQRVRVGPSISLLSRSKIGGSRRTRGARTCSKDVRRLNFLTSQFGCFLLGWPCFMALFPPCVFHLCLCDLIIRLPS